jgi:dolichol kinase
MNIIELKERTDLAQDVKLTRVYAVFQEFLAEIKTRKFPNQFIEAVNRDIEEINLSSKTDFALRDLIRAKMKNIVMLLKQNHNIALENYYRNKGLSIAMFLGLYPLLLLILNGAVLPAIGVFVATIGMAVIGINFGDRKDKKAFEEGRQLKMKTTFFTYSYGAKK